jgi:succinate--hydroxymethylglutarate CoA-transferase
MSCYFAAVNRNKRSITLDVKKEEGKAILLHLANDADVLQVWVFHGMSVLTDIF